MSLEDLGNIGEFVAAVGVIISLIYLAVQIRQNTRTVRSASYQSIVNTANDLGHNFTRAPGFTDLWAQGAVDPGKLNEEQLVKLRAHLVGMFRFYENVFYQHQQGTIDRKMWPGWQHDMLIWFNRPGFRQMWQEICQRYSAEFRRFLEEHGDEL
jgi:hypothetical protein